VGKRRGFKRQWDGTEASRVTSSVSLIDGAEISRKRSYLPRIPFADTIFWRNFVVLPHQAWTGLGNPTH
jgi:hypothetical protein